MQIGDRLNQRYTLTARLGSGAMGDVFQATDATTGQPVALKILDRKLTLDPDMVERFKREGEALRQLRHRHIVAFIDTFQHDGQQVIVMECVSGGSLHQLIKRGPLLVEQARQMAIDLCDALTSAHRLNIIHRDIKPENVLLAADGTPKLTDFGVARLVGEGTRLTGTGTQIGTPFYMSPEAWQGQPLDARADIWSLGIMLYEMLTGGVPFGGDTLVAVMNKVLTAPLPDLKKLRPDTPPALLKIVRRMLERDKAKRYQSLREVGLDLERATTAVSAASAPALATKAAPVGATVRKPLETRSSAKGLPRWAWVAGGLAIALILCLLAAGGGALAMKLMSQPKTATYTPAPAGLAPSPSSLPPPSPPVSNHISPIDDMVMVYVPAGNFLMGSSDSDSQARSNEKPQHTVYLDAYWIDKTEVTQEMYDHCVASGECRKPACSNGGSNYPVICVTSEDAGNYCTWAERRLPTEAEWEKAARGTDGRLYPWGNNPPDPTLANFNLNINDTTAVGNYPAGASPYGALDMAGNAWEWVNDWYDSGYYRVSPLRNPTGPATGTDKVLKGGSGATLPGTSAWRTGPLPVTGGYMALSFGFRCAAAPDGKSAAPTPTPPPATAPAQPTNTPVPPPNTSVPATLQAGSTQVAPQDGMVMDYVPAGGFWMGSTDADSSAAADEKPQHIVSLDAYWIDQTDVTASMYAKCVATGQCQAAGCHTESKYDNHPAVCVDWSNALAYCRWAGRRLPTEAEWEKAARGTDGRLHPWGNDAPSPTLANYSLNVNDTTEVGKYPAGASPYGALDMAGNVWQWVNDWYGEKYYSTSPASNPPGPDSGTTKVVRGTGWSYSSDPLRAALRNKDVTTTATHDIGFRCAATP
jgi:eukaryotic-like serine/threonine-protein kinase